MSYFTDLTSNSSRVAYIKAKIMTNDAWAKRALVRIYEEQTQDEQVCGATRVQNGVGFTGADGVILTSFAQQFIAKNRLSPKQMKMVHDKMPKYAAQLEKLIRGV